MTTIEEYEKQKVEFIRNANRTKDVKQELLECISQLESRISHLSDHISRFLPENVADGSLTDWKSPVSGSGTTAAAKSDINLWQQIDLKAELIFNISRMLGVYVESDSNDYVLFYFDTSSNGAAPLCTRDSSDRYFVKLRLYWSEIHLPTNNVMPSEHISSSGKHTKSLHGFDIESFYLPRSITLDQLKYLVHIFHGDNDEKFVEPSESCSDIVYSPELSSFVRHILFMVKAFAIRQADMETVKKVFDQTLKAAAPSVNWDRIELTFQLPSELLLRITAIYREIFDPYPSQLTIAKQRVTFNENEDPIESDMALFDEIEDIHIDSDNNLLTSVRALMSKYESLFIENFGYRPSAY